MNRGLLIAGTSHTGKSTLAEFAGQSMGCEVLSTDHMARHPGRPWQNPRPHVSEFYANLSVETIHTLLQHHHANMRSSILSIIDQRMIRRASFVFEGSALRPKFFADLDIDNVQIVCLFADDTFLRKRVYEQSNYHASDAAEQFLINRFVERSLRDNIALIEEAQQAGITCLDVSDEDAVLSFRETI